MRTYRVRDLKALPVLFLFAALLLACGCGNGPGVSGGKELIARIGDYEMTEEDFYNEVRLAGYGTRLPDDPDEARAQLLDEVITRKVLVQEAVRQHLEKEPSFVAEIERYWEQALLKQLFNKKMRELAAAAAGGEDEAMEPEVRRELFNKKIQGELDRWMEDLKDKSGVTVYDENLKKLDVRR